MTKPLLCLLLLLPCLAAAQSFDDGYYPFAVREEPQPMIETDTTLFYRAVQAAEDAYGRITDFNLPQVSLRRRGQEFRDERIELDGIVVSWRHTAALRLLGAAEERTAGIAAESDAPGAAGGVRRFVFTPDEALTPHLASVRLTDRNYRVGAKVSSSLDVGRGWRLRVAADARTGRDMHVEGVFTNALTAGFHLSKRFAGGSELSLLAVVPPSVRGTRLSSVEEAFTLTGDPLYNPAWGFQQRRVRNSRVRRECVSLGVASWRMPLTAKTSLALTLGGEAGLRRYSALGWYDARTPMPDNYRYLPSYTGDRESEQAWRSRDARYTQVRWDELIAQNRLAGGEAVYALEDRVERIGDVQADAAFVTELDGRLTLRYGGWVRRTSTRHYKQMRDLLGADYLVDIDQYLVDDDTYGNLLQNDLRHPDRRIGRGDRFGYDYTLAVREAGVRLHAAYRSDRLRADAGLVLSDGVIFRRGHYEKELFPGAQSYGASRRLHFTPYTLRLSAGWAFTPRHYLSAALLAAARMPEAEALFFQPQYNNRTVDRPTAEKNYAAELAYRMTGPVVGLQVTAYATLRLDAAQTQRYYDDMAGLYCDMSVSGIGWRALGVEAAADIRLSQRWSLALAASVQRSEYVRDPLVTVLSDADNTVVDMRAVSRMGGCVPGGAPRATACAELAYFGPKGWGCRLSAGYVGGRYAEPSFLRRTDRIASQGGTSPELFDAFVRQERLDDALTLGASLFKSFYFDRSRLVAALMLRNLLGDNDMVYSAYEAQRVRRIAAGDQTLWQPHATRLTYALPRSFYVTVSYRF